MKIKAKSKFDYKTIKAFVRMQLSRKTNPFKKILLHSLVCVILLFVILMEIYLLGPSALMIVLLVVSALMLLLELYMYFILPRTRYHALGNLKGCVNEFQFHDTYLLMESKDEGYSGESRVDYELLTKTIETTKYFYIFQSKTQVLIVDKSTLSGGTCHELRQVLQAVLGDQYVIYKY